MVPPNGRLGALALCLLVVAAGCAGLLDQQPGTPSPSPTDAPVTTSPETVATPTPNWPDVDVRGGALPVDQDVVFGRVLQLLGHDVRPPTVERRNLTERKGYDPGRIPFFDAVGLAEVDLNESAPGGATAASGNVYLHPADGDDAAVERVLAHEFTHTVQIRSGMLPWLDAIGQPPLTMDLLQTRLALTEGGAVLATDAYVRRYQPDAVGQSSTIAERFRDGTPAERLFWARYHFGVRYVEHRIDGPANLSAAYEDHPRTSEGIIHNRTRGEDPPRNLSVSVADVPPGWSSAGRNRMGELVTRFVLETELSRERAATAAAGWGNDSLYGVRNGDRWAWAWTFRWDSPAEADEFETAFETYADGRSEGSEHAFRLVRTGETTTVAFVGDPVIVGNATATADGGNVSVSLGG